MEVADGIEKVAGTRIGNAYLVRVDDGVLIVDTSMPRSARRILVASLAGGVVSLQMGAFSVVLQTFLSGNAALPFTTFLLMMQPIHLAIGIVEGFVTAGVVNYVRGANVAGFLKVANAMLAYGAV